MEIYIYRTINRMSVVLIIKHYGLQWIECESMIKPDTNLILNIFYIDKII